MSSATKKKKEKKPNKYEEKVVINATFEEIMKATLNYPGKPKKELKKD